MFSGTLEKGWGSGQTMNKLILATGLLAGAVTSPLAAQQACEVNPFGNRHVVAVENEIYAISATSNRFSYGIYTGPGNNNNDYSASRSGQNGEDQTSNIDYALVAADLEGDGRAELVAAWPRVGGGTALPQSVGPDFENPDRGIDR